MLSVRVCPRDADKVKVLDLRRMLCAEKEREKSCMMRELSAKVRVTLLPVEL